MTSSVLVFLCVASDRLLHVLLHRLDHGSYFTTHESFRNIILRCHLQQTDEDFEVPDCCVHVPLIFVSMLSLDVDVVTVLEVQDEVLLQGSIRVCRLVVQIEPRFCFRVIATFREKDLDEIPALEFQIAGETPFLH